MPKRDKIKFDALSATVTDWESLFTNEDALWKDFDREDCMSQMAVFLKEVTDSDISEKKRSDIAEKAVQAILNSWEKLPKSMDFFRDSQHPLDYIALFAYKNNVLCKSIVPIITKLWSKAPKNPPYNFTVKRLIQGLGVLIPEDQVFLEKLYVEHNYSSILEIILERGEAERASALFRDSVERYNGMDPLGLDSLIWAGLSFDDAKFWLDQSCNSQPGYEGWYNDALNRWPKIIKMRDEKKAA